MNYKVEFIKSENKWAAYRELTPYFFIMDEDYDVVVQKAKGAIDSYYELIKVEKNN